MNRLIAAILVGASVTPTFTPVSLEAAGLVNSPEPPVIPIGLDAYRMWDRWAYLRIGQRTYMTSTYDRRGGNESADASHFLYQLADDRNVTLDVMGPGVLAFARYNHWHGSPWHYVVDGRDYVVRETSTSDPEHPAADSVFIPEKPFPNPLTWTWSHTKGADLMWVPLPFERSFTMMYERTRYGTGYYIYHRFMPGATNLSRPIRGWTPEDVPPQDVLDLINRSGTDIAPTPSPCQGEERGEGNPSPSQGEGRGEGDPSPSQGEGGREGNRIEAGTTRPSRSPPLPGKRIIALSGRLSMAANERKTLAAIDTAPSTIRALRFSIAQADAKAFSETRLRARWDDSPHASVDAPINLLFGAGTIYNREGREYLVKAFPVNIRFADGRVHFAMYFPMPFLRNARFELLTPPTAGFADLDWSIRHEPYTDPANWACRFHATYVDHGEPTPGKDLVLLDTTKTEGGGDWCGHFVGTSFIFSDRAFLGTLEGDPRFFFDDSNTPQAQGTGTEEWCGGGDYWGGRTMTLPFAGHPVGARSETEAKCEEDRIESAYRFLLSDLMPFGRNARIQLEHGGTNDSTEHYRSVTFWYGVRGACLVPTDTFHVGDAADEAKHEYDSPTASPVQTVTSRYEWGPDHREGKEIYPETTDTGRFMTGTSTFTLKLDPNNLGVLLRRKMDYSFPNQCARISVADVRSPGPVAWHEAGTWYTAGSNTVVYSDPKGELGATLHNVQTSNRRWRDDEFLLPRRLTQGRTAIRVRVEFTPRNIPLFPGHPLPAQAWSEFRYRAYCYRMPEAAGFDGPDRSPSAEP